MAKESPSPRVLGAETVITPVFSWDFDFGWLSPEASSYPMTVILLDVSALAPVAAGIV